MLTPQKFRSFNVYCGLIALAMVIITSGCRTSSGAGKLTTTNISGPNDNACMNEGNAVINVFDKQKSFRLVDGTDAFFVVKNAYLNKLSFDDSQLPDYTPGKAVVVGFNSSGTAALSKLAETAPEKQVGTVEVTSLKDFTDSDKELRKSALTETMLSNTLILKELANTTESESGTGKTMFTVPFDQLGKHVVYQGKYLMHDDNQVVGDRALILTTRHIKGPVLSHLLFAQRYFKDVLLYKTRDSANDITESLRISNPSSYFHHVDAFVLSEYNSCLGVYQADDGELLAPLTLVLSDRAGE
ncbi:MAG: hypothetical protein OXC40_04470 [Proteobacteria bacterium]|nr:hypothetical protein [Pseudomonadota bacterium]